MTAVDTCDVCIVGAGLAGMNALFVAGQYLNPGQKVILLERRSRVGGMWVDTYPYVRLHQAHGQFTAGNIGWTIGKDRGYLATKPEVLDHFEHCLRQVTQRITVDERFGWSFLSDEPAADGTVRISCVSPSAEHRVITAKRLIKAYGFGVQPNDPLPLSSKRIRSVSPDLCDVRAGEIAESADPVWIIGSGKTAMDTAHALITTCPEREVNVLAGSGTFFLSRDHISPVGMRRWLAGTPISTLGEELGRVFTGANEDDGLRWLQSRYGTAPIAQTGQFLLGVLSEAESRTIRAGLDRVVMGHLVDVVDDGARTELLLRSGESIPVEHGSWVVNCTGYLAGADTPDEPYTSHNGSVLSIQTHSATLHLTSFAGYFMTHLMFLDKLATVPLYAMDIQELTHRAKSSVAMTMITLARHNLGLIADEVPTKVFADCGLDFDRWYPWHRRTAAALRFMRTHRADRERLRRTLDTVGERFEIRCGPLESVTKASATAAG